MHTRTLEKPGVPGVLRVPETLKASNGAAFREGNTNEKSQNTMPGVHLWCSVTRQRKAEHVSRLFPAGRLALRDTQRTPAPSSAAIECATLGAGG